MKKKIGFIMPRLIGATVVVGLAAFVITTLFKLLLGITLIAGVISLIARKASKRRKQWMAQNAQGHMPNFSHQQSFGNHTPWGRPVQPFNNYSTQKGTTIVPIN